MLFAEEHVDRPFRGLRYRRRMLSEATTAMREVAAQWEPAAGELSAACGRVRELAASCVQSLLDLDAWRGVFLPAVGRRRDVLARVHRARFDGTECVPRGRDEGHVGAGRHLEPVGS